MVKTNLQEVHEGVSNYLKKLNYDEFLFFRIINLATIVTIFPV